MASMLTGTPRLVGMTAPSGTMDVKILVREKVTRVDPVRISRAVANVWQLADPLVEAPDVILPDWSIEEVADSDGPVVEVVSAVVGGTQLVNQNPVKTLNHDRDQWMLDQWNGEKTYGWIRRNIPATWGKLKSVQAVERAIKAHAKRHSLHRRRGKGGRPRNSA